MCLVFDIVFIRKILSLFLLTDDECWYNATFTPQTTKQSQLEHTTHLTIRAATSPFFFFLFLNYNKSKSCALISLLEYHQKV